MRKRALFAARLAGKLVLTLLLVSAVVFALVSASGDPSRRLLGPTASPEQIASFREHYGLDRSLPARYADWLAGAVRGDLGRTYVTDEPVWSLIRPRLGRSLALAAIAWCLMVLVGVPLGLVSGIRGGRLDAGVSGVSLALVAVPGFVIGILLLDVFAVRLGWLPANSSGAALAGSPLDALPSYVLPALTVALGGTIHTLRLTRANARDVAAEPYVRAAELRGLSQRVVAFRHVLPNAAPPVVGQLALRLGALVGGMVIAENVFGFPGLGLLLIDSVQSGNTPVVLAIAVIVAAIYVLANAAADVVVDALTPKRRRAAG
jgi:peptide/nickel transport system permease protein